MFLKIAILIFAAWHQVLRRLKKTRYNVTKSICFGQTTICSLISFLHFPCLIFVNDFFAVYFNQCLSQRTK